MFHLLLSAQSAEYLPTSRGEPVNAFLIDFDHSSKLLLVLKQLSQVHVDVTHGAIMPLELCHGLL